MKTARELAHLAGANHDCAGKYHDEEHCTDERHIVLCVEVTAAIHAAQVEALDAARKVFVKMFSDADPFWHGWKFLDRITTLEIEALRPAKEET